jgi:hypothetical protein
MPPSVGVLWTPGYWGFAGGRYAWHEGYWGPQVGFYGGVNYGNGYFGSGFTGGRWEGGVFRHNTVISNVDATTCTILTRTARWFGKSRVRITRSTVRAESRHNPRGKWRQAARLTKARRRCKSRMHKRPITAIWQLMEPNASNGLRTSPRRAKSARGIAPASRAGCSRRRLARAT